MTGAVALPAARLARAHRADLVLGGTLGTLALGLALEVTTGPDRIGNPFLPAIVLLTALNGVLGHAVARRRPGHAVGIVLQAIGVVGAVMVLAGGHANAALFGPLPDTGATLTLWLSRWLWVPLGGLQSSALLFAFPDGRLPSPRWRPVAALAAVGVAIFALQAMATPFAESVWDEVPVENPMAGVLGPVAGLGPVGPGAFVLASLAGATTMLVRRHHAVGDERARLRWVAPSAVFVPPALAASLLGRWWWGGFAEMLAVTLLAVAVTVATIRNRMYDADVALNRAVVAGLLVVSLLGAYVAVVVVVGELVGRTSWIPGVVGAAVVALAFGPLLHRLREGVQQLLFGTRGSPEAVVTRLLRASEQDAADEEVLGRAAATLRESLRLPWVGIEAAGRAVTSGEPRTAGHVVPLLRGDREVGRLVVGSRFDGERVDVASPALTSAAAQLALTVDTLELALALRQARDHLVVAREEERRRIRRDLHDGLGPALAGVTLGLEGVEKLSMTDPAAAAQVLPELREHAQRAVADVRRLVEGLRPADLDDVGLVESLRSGLERLSTPHGPVISLHTDDPLPTLPAATEVAVLRIALEAATNVVRHAAARRCDVQVRVRPPWLVVEVTDDGVGAAGAKSNVGLISMRERAEEVGGTFRLSSSTDGGTTVAARLPLEVA